MRSINSATLRALLGEVYRSSSEFDAFCQDYFPAVYRRFTSGMDRVARENLLFEQATPDRILLALKENRPQDYEAPLARLAPSLGSAPAGTPEPIPPAGAEPKSAAENKAPPTQPDGAAHAKDVVGGSVRTATPAAGGAVLAWAGRGFALARQHRSLLLVPLLGLGLLAAAFATCGGSSPKFALELGAIVDLADRQAVQKAVLGAAARFNDCLREHGPGPTPSSRAVRFVLHAERGHATVLDARVEQADAGDRDLAECWLKQFQDGLRLPRAADSDRAYLSLELRGL